MNKKKGIRLAVLFLTAAFSVEMNAQQTYQELEQITVNEQVTTVVTASEPIHFVDVSTDKIAGDKPIDNTVRFKPKTLPHTVRSSLYYQDGRGCFRQGNHAPGKNVLYQSFCLALHGRYDPLCPSCLEQPSKDT